MWEWVFRVKMRPIRYAAGSSTEIVYTRGLKKKKVFKSEKSLNTKPQQIMINVCVAPGLTQFGTELNVGQFDSVKRTRGKIKINQGFFFLYI